MSAFNKLPLEIKTALMFNEWIMYSLKAEEIEKNYYDDYRNFRYWCVDIMCSKTIFYSDIPSVNSLNQNKVFKKSRSMLELKKLSTVEDFNFELILNDNGKYEPRILGKND